MSQANITLVVLERIDAAANMARFYSLSVEESLLGGATLVREWGRIGAAGRRRIELHDSHFGATAALQAWLRRKQQRGYQVRSAGRSSMAEELGTSNSPPR